MKTKEKPEAEVRIGFLCSTSFHHHMGKKKGERPDPKGVIVYPTVDDLKASRKCVTGNDACGIVRVKVVLDKVVKKARKWT